MSDDLFEHHITIPRERLRLEEAESALEVASRVMGERAQAMREVVAERDAAMAALTAVVREHPDDDQDGNAPGHGHLIPGVWDEDNGKRAGKPCHWCATWKQARTLVDAARAREGGNV